MYQTLVIPLQQEQQKSRVQNSWRLQHVIESISHKTAVIVAWLERFENQLEFPVAELTASLHSPVNVSSGYFSTLTKKGSDFTLPVIFIHPLSSGLYRISTRITSYRLEEHLLLFYLWSSVH